MKESFGAIEAGGTKFLCTIGRDPTDLADPVRIPTTTPDETLCAVIDALRCLETEHGQMSAVGIASFGPADLDPKSPRWGWILSTTKGGWSNVDFGRRVATAFAVPVGFDTDVNGAALAEARWGRARGTDVAVYVTVGTGVGGGVLVNGDPLRGLRHPELGHIIPPRHPSDSSFQGLCPFHGCCLEGLVSGPAIIQRWQTALCTLPLDHPGHQIVGWYLGYLAATLIATLSPQRIIFGGGVLETPGLIDRIRDYALQFDRGYSFAPEAQEDLICLPRLGNRAGVLGGILLAERAYSAGRSLDTSLLEVQSIAS